MEYYTILSIKGRYAVWVFYSIEFIAYVFELVLGIYGVYMAKKAMCNWMCILIFIVVLFIFLIGSFNCEKKYWLNVKHARIRVIHVFMVEDIWIIGYKEINNSWRVRNGCKQEWQNKGEYEEEFKNFIHTIMCFGNRLLYRRSSFRLAQMAWTCDSRSYVLFGIFYNTD